MKTQCKDCNAVHSIEYTLRRAHSDIEGLPLCPCGSDNVETVEDKDSRAQQSDKMDL